MKQWKYDDQCSIMYCVKRFNEKTEQEKELNDNQEAEKEQRL